MKREIRQKLVTALGALLGAAFVMAGLLSGGAFIDVCFPDARSEHARLSLDTPEVAPGDEVWPLDGR